MPENIFYRLLVNNVNNRKQSLFTHNSLITIPLGPNKQYKQ